MVKTISRGQDSPLPGEAEGGDAVRTAAGAGWVRPGGTCGCQFSSVQFSRSVVSNSLRPHEPQHARPPCPSPTPAVHPNPCPSSWWCHPTISSSVVPFASCPQSSLASGSFQMSQLFAWGGWSIGHCWCCELSLLLYDPFWTWIRKLLEIAFLSNIISIE